MMCVAHPNMRHVILFPFTKITRCATFSHLISDQAIKLQGLSPEEVVEIDAHRMGQDFAIDTAGQVPQITRPDFGDVELFRQLPYNGFNQAPDFDQRRDKIGRACVKHIPPQRRF